MRNTELYHHGIKGQKWGLRRFQNKDGSLTDLGRQRYGDRWDSMSDDEKRERIKNSGDTNLVYAARGSMNNHDLQYALNRIDLEQKISTLHRGTRKTGYDYIQSAIKMAETGMKAYETYGKVKKAYDKATGKGAPDMEEKVKKVIASKDLNEISKYSGYMTKDQIEKVAKMIALDKTIKNK